MSLESEARKQLEAQRRAAQELERKKLADKQALEAHKRALDLERERFKSQAISKFRGLNPERFLEEVRRTWRVGRMVHYSDPLYKEINQHDLYGVMLYQRGDTQHSKKSEKSRWGRESIDGTGGHDVWIRGYTIEESRYPFDIAVIGLTLSGDVTLKDSSGHGGKGKRTNDREPGFFELFDKKSVFEYGAGSMSFSLARQFRIDSVRPEDIRAFFVETTARRMGGAGNIRIR